MKKQRLSLLAIIICLSLTITSIAYAVKYGAPDGDAHSYVCLVVVDDELGPTYRGTGTLISPNIVLTAGHLTDGAVGARVWFDSDVTGNPDYPNGGPSAIEGTPYTHPLYIAAFTPGDPVGISYDVGIVVLNEPVFLTEYGVVPSVGHVDTLKMMSWVDQVGYGVQVRELSDDKPYGPPDWDNPKVRMYAPAQLIKSKHQWSDMFIKTTANPAKGKGGTCYGDSGGPVFIKDTNIVIGLTSWGTNYPCSGVSYAQRTDLAEVSDFINEKRETHGVIGYTNAPLIRNYEEESVIGDWVTDVIRTYDSSIDFAFQNPSGLRNDIDAGTITYVEIFNVYPFDNTVVLCSMTGAEVVTVLEEGITALKGVIEVSGLSFTYDWNQPAGSRMSTVIDLSTSSPLVPSQTYTVAVNSFIADGGDGHITLPTVPQVDTTTLVRDLLVDWTMVNSPFTPPDPVTEQRVTILGTPP